MIQLNVRIGAGLKDDFSAYCKSNGISMSDEIKQFMVDFINKNTLSIEIDNFFSDALKDGNKRLKVRIDENLRDKFYNVCESKNLPISFVIRSHIVRCVSIYNALKWWNEK